MNMPSNGIGQRIAFALGASPAAASTVAVKVKVATDLRIPALRMEGHSRTERREKILNRSLDDHCPLSVDALERRGRTGPLIEECGWCCYFFDFFLASYLYG